MSDTVLKKADLKSHNDVRWCPGCGDYAILSSVQSVMAELGVPRHQYVIVSGIGCSSRFPYYVSTYGFHGIHGRAPAIATGIKVANPELSVWVVTGDGDGLSIGGNHLIHALRRNVDLKILLFNNQIYGLTKGQYSPTSPVGSKTKSTPLGSIDRPFNPITLALGAGATFVARTVDIMGKHMKQVFEAAAKHKGSALVEIWQNCLVFNDGAFSNWAARPVRDDRLVDLQHGEPLVFGKDGSKGITFDCGEPRYATAAEASIWRSDTLTSAPALVLSEMDYHEELPRAIGVFRQVSRPVYDAEIWRQLDQAQSSEPRGDLRDLIFTKDTWTVE